MINFQRLFFSMGAVIFLTACKNPAATEPSAAQANRMPDREAVKRQFMTANRQLMEKENDEMDYYENTHRLPFVKTSSGIRYHVYKPSVRGDSIRSGMQVTLSYDVKLLDGTPCYSSKTDGKKTFLVERGEVESGIHRGVQYLKRGDKAILLIPSPLAHGLLGDFKKIPPQMPIVYEIHVE